MFDTALTENLRNKLKVRNLQAKTSFAQKHPHAKAFFDTAQINLANLREHSAKTIAAGSLAGTLLLTGGQASQGLSLPEPIVRSLNSTNSGNFGYSPEWLSEHLKKMIPPIHNAFAQPFLNFQEEKIIAKTVEMATGVKAVSSLEGEHLNTTYGYIGAEQHLRRWPGDTIAGHGELAHVEGMAPGNGGFGYFARGPQDQEGVGREKYYVAVQTLYLPDWHKRLKYLVNWYKWRKVIVVNPDNGAAVVAVVGDAGPASWTGKHFGGSPEVMDHLGGRRYKKGRVLLFFIDDPNNKIALGPVGVGKQSITPTLEALLKVEPNVLEN